MLLFATRRDVTDGGTRSMPSPRSLGSSLRGSCLPPAHGQRTPELHHQCNLSCSHTTSLLRISFLSSEDKPHVQRRLHVRCAHALIVPWLFKPLAVHKLNIVLPQQPGQYLLYLGMCQASREFSVSEIFRIDTGDRTWRTSDRYSCVFLSRRAGMPLSYPLRSEDLRASALGRKLLVP